jgi:ABC-type amino acid transport substrate-binding protein
MGKILFAWLTLGIAGATLQAEQIKIVEFVHRPFAYQDSKTKEARGAEVAMLRDILLEAGLSAEFTFVPFPRLIILQKSGDFAMGPLVTKTPDREKVLVYPTKPVMVQVPALVVGKESPLTKITTPQDLKGLRIGFVTGQQVPKFLDVPNLFFLDTLSADDPGVLNVNKLLAKRLDAVLTLNNFSTKATIKDLGVQDKLRFVPLPVEGSCFYFTVTKNTAASDRLLAILNKALDSGKYDLARYMEAELR